MILPSDQTTVEPISCPAVGIFVPVIEQEYCNKKNRENSTKIKDLDTAI